MDFFFQLSTCKNYPIISLVIESFALQRNVHRFITTLYNEHFHFHVKHKKTIFISVLLEKIIDKDCDSIHTLFIPPANEVAGVYSDPYVRPFVRSFVRPSIPPNL